MLRSLAHLPSIESRVACIDERVRAHTTVAPHEINDLLHAAHQGDQESRAVCVALGVWRARLADQALENTLRQQAAPHLLAAPLFDDKPARLALSSHARVEPKMAARSTLPVYKQRRVFSWVDEHGGSQNYTESRTQREQLLVSLMLPSLMLGIEQDTLKRLLDEPLLDSKTVTSLAAKRPNSVDSLRLIVGHSRWMPDEHVRRAVVCNPYAPPWLTHALVPSLPKT